MIDIRPVANIVGKVVVTLGAAMALPMLVDWWHGDPHWLIFLECGILTTLAGGLVALSTRQVDKSLTIQQVFLLTAMLWLVVPVAGALPFMLGAPHVALPMPISRPCRASPPPAPRHSPIWTTCPRARICGGPS